MSDHGQLPLSEAMADRLLPAPQVALEPSRVGRLSVRVRLMLFLVGVSLPIAAFAGYFAYVKRQDDLDNARDAIRRYASELALDQRAAIVNTRQLLAVFAQSLAYRDLLLAGCGESGGALEAIGEHLPGIMLLDRAGGAVCTRPSLDPALAPAVRRLFEQAQRSRRFAVQFSNEGDAGAGQGNSLMAAMPIVADNSLRGVVVAKVPGPDVARARRGGDLPDGTAAWIVADAGTSHIISLDGDERLLPADRADLPSVAEAGGAIDRRSSSGRAAFVAVAKATEDFYALVAVPSETAARRADFDFSVRLGLILVWFAVGLLLMKLGVRYALLNPLRSLTNAIRAYGGAQAPFRPPSDLAQMPVELRELAARFTEVADANVQRELKLNRLVDQRDLLVREIHHRVKNNLQIVTSLLNLQAQRIRHPAAREALFAARERVSALSLLHRHLYLQQDVNAIDFRSFLHELAEQLSTVMEGQGRERVAIEVEAPTIRVASDQVVPLGLIVTEVITNAFKHGFGDGQGGAIQVRLRLLDDEQAELAITDDGRHHEPPEITQDEEGVDGLGRLLIAGFVQQLDGTMETSLPGEPYWMKLRFPLKVAVERA